MLRSEPEFNITKQASDIDSFERETVTFEVQISDRDAKVEWYFNNQVY